MAQTFEIEWKSTALDIAIPLSEYEIICALEYYIRKNNVLGPGFASVRCVDDLHDMPLSTSMEEKI